MRLLKLFNLGLFLFLAVLSAILFQYISDASMILDFVYGGF